MRQPGAAAILLLTLALSGCGERQSALRPGGAVAEAQASLTYVMVVGGALILTLVCALTLFAVFGSDRWRTRYGRESFVVAGGLVFPALVLAALLVYGLLLTRDDIGRDGARIRIEVVGEQFWWRIRYLDPDGRPILETANEIVIPVAQTIALSLKSADVIHSFWVPNLAGKIDMIPGRVNDLHLRADRVGIFRGQCAEYCGAQHARMAFYVRSVEAEEFDRWRKAQTRPAEEPENPSLKRGAALFVAAGCGACHAIRGTSSQGSLGPDLTHVGARATIAAGLLPNNAGALAGWIASSQHLKPGNRMPSFAVFSGVELRLVAEYLQSLK